MKIKRILITGAEGFIGSHLTEALIKKGYKVRALVLYNSFNSKGWLGEISKNKNLEIVYGDIRDENFTNKLIKGCDIVYHLAALISIPYSYVSTKSFIETNINGTHNILQGCLQNKISKLIVTSTSEVYGTAQQKKIHETHILNAQSPYAATKTAADQLSMSFYYTYGLPVCILRPFNTYGPRQSLRAIIPTIIKQLITSKNYIKLGDISTTRDFTYIDDTISGFLSVLNSKKCIGKVINISANQEVKISVILKILKSLMNQNNIKVLTDKKRLRPKNSEVYRLHADTSNAKKYLNWHPKYKGKDGLLKGLKKTIKWFQDQDIKNLKKKNNYNI